MVKQRKAKGLILRKARAKDNDQILVVFTKNLGKIFLIAKGARKITSKRIGALNTLNVIKFNYTGKNQQHYLKEVELISSLQSLKKDYEKRKAVIILAEILDKLLPLNQKEEEIYAQTKIILRTINQNPFLKENMLDSTQKLLVLLGYLKPEQKLKSWSELIEQIHNISEREFQSNKL